jgi:sugar O-acyltransferase (sialic acid O-acetyltransferase NeuD family)
MNQNKEKLVIVGCGETGEIAYEYFSADTNFEVVGFSAEKKFMKNQTLFGLPVIPLEELEKAFDPQDCRVFVAVSFTELNRVRTRLLRIVKEKGFRTCSYISPKAFIGKNVEIGENCFIFEGVTIQRGSKIGNNVTIWSGSFIAHCSVIGDNCFISAQVAVSGFCSIGENCFLGINSCTKDKIAIAKDTVIGAGAVVIEDTESGKIYVGNPAKPLPHKTVEAFIAGVAQI